MADEQKKDDKLPLQKEFAPKGEYRQVSLEPVDDSNPMTPAKVLEVQFGEYTTWRAADKSDAKVSGRYQVTYPQVVDGVEQHVVALAVAADKAIAQVIKQAGRGSIDDYVVDLDDDFFKQKIEAPKIDANDVWGSPKFAEVRDDLAEAMGAAEQTLTTLEDARENAQEEAFKLAEILRGVFDMIGGSRKALEAWARGPSGSTNHPHLSKLGKGANALYEAMLPSYLSETQRELLPSTLTSGKGIVRHKSLAIQRVTQDCTIKVDWPEGYETKAGARLPDLSGMAALLRRVAEKVFHVENASQLDLTQLGEAVEEVAATKIAEFNVEFGKSVNTYDKDEYSAALLAYGRATVTSGGENLFGKIIEQVEAVNGEDDEKIVKALTDLFNNNLLAKKMVETCWQHRNVVDKEQRNREIMQEVDEEDGPISKTAAKGFAKLDPLPAAAHLFKLLCTHPKADEVWADMKALVAQHDGRLSQTGDDEPEEDAA